MNERRNRKWNRIQISDTVGIFHFRNRKLKNNKIRDRGIENGNKNCIDFQFFSGWKKRNGGGRTETTFKIVTSGVYSFPHINSPPERIDLITR